MPCVYAQSKHRVMQQNIAGAANFNCCLETGGQYIFIF